MAYSEKAKQVRGQCIAFTLEGYGPRCQMIAMIGSNVCQFHRGKPHNFSDPTDKLNKRLFPRLFEKRGMRHLACNCSAYPSPHQAGAGLCKWPEPPTHQLITDRADNEETKLKKKLRKMGLRTNCIKRRTGEVKPIIEHKPEDLTMSEAYQAEKAVNIERQRIERGFDDFSSLPIEEKQRIWKEQILAEFYKQYPQRNPKAYPHTVEVDGKKLRYKIVKDRDWKSWVILENGRKISLSDET